MSFKLQKTGDWVKAGRALNNLATNTFNRFKTTMYLSSEKVLQKVISHIDSQDLSWTPLAASTVKMKGNDKIYIDTGALRDSLESRLNSESKSFISYVISSRKGATYPDGTPINDVLSMMEYGTSRMPPRPILRPTAQEVRHEIIEDAYNTLKNLGSGR